MGLKRLFRRLNQAPLLKRVCFYSFCFGVGLAALVIFVQSAMLYEVRRKELLTCIESAVTGRLDGLGNAAWRADDTAITTVLTEIQQTCRSRHYENLTPLFLAVDQTRGARIEVGEMQDSGQLITLHYPVSYWNDSGVKEYWLGELHAVQNLSVLQQVISQAAISQLLTYIFILGCSASLGVALGYWLIIRRVRRFMAEFRRHDISDTIRHSIASENSEVSQLWAVILKLRDDLDEKYQAAVARLKQLELERDSALKASEAKSQFLAKMSHELRTPMNGLLGFSALLLESKLADEQREYAQTIQVSLESLLHVVNDVLDLSRIESGDLNVTSIPFSLRSVISGVSSLLRNRAESKHLAFDVRISPEIPHMLQGDPVRIRQILMNLVSNAIQYTDQGHVLINVGQVKQVEGEITISIAIEDTGTGLEQRGKSVSKYAAQGITGFSSEFRARRSLGLDICYQLAELMDAKIEHTSTDEGSTFWLEITLPIVKTTGVQSAIDFSLVKELYVLVIDSYELSRKITLELLQGWGIGFEAVSTAEEALHLLSNSCREEGRFNMVLCDDLLQDLAGIDACLRIRQLVPKSVRIVILCSNPQLGDAEGFFLSGANGFLSKQQRDPYLRSVMCQVYAERNDSDQYRKHLVTRYSVSDAANMETLLQTHEQQKGLVLVVEDNIVNQQLAARLLNRLGYQVDLAANGFEALELYKANRYELILMDCLMPDMDGYETTQIIREIENSDSQKKRTPIVALTAHAIEGEADRCFQVGMDEFITKPFKLAQLEMVLERYIH